MVSKDKAIHTVIETYTKLADYTRPLPLSMPNAIQCTNSSLDTTGFIKGRYIVMPHVFARGYGLVSWKAIVGGLENPAGGG